MLPLELVEELALEVAGPEEQPVATGGALRFAVLQEPAERRDAGARADHDHIPRGVGWQPEPFVLLDEYLRSRVGARQAGQESRRGAQAALAVDLVIDDGDREVGRVGQAQFQLCVFNSIFEVDFELYRMGVVFYANGFANDRVSLVEGAFEDKFRERFGILFENHARRLPDLPHG